MKLRAIFFNIAALFCGIIAAMFATADPDSVAAAGAAAGFSVSVGLLGIAAALSQKPNE